MRVSLNFKQNLKKIADSYKLLEDQSVVEFENYVVQAQEGVREDLSEFKFGASGEILLVDFDKGTVFDKGIEEGTDASYGFVDAMLANESGFTSYRTTTDSRYGSYRKFEPWK